MSDFLAAEGIPALAGYRAEHITGDLDLVVVGNAISRGNPELEEVLDRKIRYCSLPEAIREHFLWGARSIVIAGTHGKTTTTSLTGWLLTHGGARSERARRRHRAQLRRAAVELPASGSGRDFVIEGDEYDSAFFDKTAKFLKYLPDIAVINNVEFDHADIYADFDAVSLAFRRLVNLVPRRGLLLLGADSPGARGADRRRRCRASRRSALGDDVDWQAHDLEPAGASTRFQVRRDGVAIRRRSRCRWSARTTCATRWRRSRSRPRSASAPSGSPKGCARSPASSAGSKSSASPTASRSTTTSRIIRPRSPRRWPACGRRIPTARIWAVFEPRSASSCRRVFQDDFARAFAGADEVLIAPVFRSTLPEAERLSVPQLVRDLHARGQSARDSRLDRRHRRGHRPRASRRAISSCSCRTAASAASTRSCCTRWRERSAEIRAMKDFRLVRAGDSALVVDFEERIDPAVNARVIRLGEAVAAARIPGVRDVVPTFRSLAVFFDPLRLDYAQLTDCIEAHAADRS